jgi:phospholipid/cholesterol/gamma-HCH transport system substrate-binding protein
VSEKLERLAGSFVVLCGLGLIGLVGIAGLDDGWFTPSNTYTVTFQDGVGLVPGLDVTVSGIVVGHIEHVELTDARQARVTLTVDRDVAPHVRVDTVATARMTVAGKQIELGEGEGLPLDDGGALVAGDNIDPFVVLNITDTLDQLGSALAELRMLSESLGLGDSELPQIIEDVAAITAEVRAGNGTLGRMVLDESLYVELQEAAAGIEQASADIAGAGAEIAAASSSIESASTSLQQGSAVLAEGATSIQSGMPTVEKGALAIEQTMVEMNTTLVELNASLERIERVLEQVPGTRWVKKDDAPPE